MSAAGTPAAVGASHTGIIGPRTAARQAGVARTHSDAITSGGPATKRDRLHLSSEESRHARSPNRRGLQPGFVVRVAERRLPSSARARCLVGSRCRIGRESRAGTRAAPRELPDSHYAAITGDGPCVWRLGAPVGQEQPSVVEEHDAIAQQAPALFRVAGNDVGRHARGIACRRALRFMAAHDPPRSGYRGFGLA
jgi:hypothetical protein